MLIQTGNTENLLSVDVCMYIFTCAEVNVCVGIHACVCVRTCKDQKLTSAVHITCSLCFYRGKVLQLSQELANLATLASLPQGFIFSVSEWGGYRLYGAMMVLQVCGSCRNVMPAWLWHGYWGSRLWASYCTHWAFSLTYTLDFLIKIEFISLRR